MAPRTKQDRQVSQPQKIRPIGVLGVFLCFPLKLFLILASRQYIHMYIQVRDDMPKVKIRKVGNSAVVTLSSEMLAMIDAKEGDTLFAVRTDDGGLKLMAENPELQKALTAAEIVMDENRDLLQALA